MYRVADGLLTCPDCRKQFWYKCCRFHAGESMPLQLSHWPCSDCYPVSDELPLSDGEDDE